MGGLAGTAFAGATPPPAPPPRPLRSVRAAPTLQAEAEALLRALAPSGQTGFALADAETGALLATHEGSRALPPASVAKIVTAAYALDALGAGHQFSTRLLAMGDVVGGQLKGDLVLVGSGDPTLDTDRLGALAARLAGEGLREISGRFLYHSGALPEMGQIAADQPVQAGYNPGVSGLNLNFNRVHFEWGRGAQGVEARLEARGQRFRPEAATTDLRIVEREAPVYTYGMGASGRESWTVARAALAQEGAVWLPVRQPAAYCAATFRALAAAQGLALPAPEHLANAPAGRVLATDDSPPLPEILREMLRYSTNLTAETVGLAAGHARGAAPASLPDSGAEMARWAEARLGLKGARFADHSGLGDASRLHPEGLVAALCQMGPKAPLGGLLREISLRESRARRLRAKTGTLNFVSGLAGFVTAQGGRELAFAIFSADLARRAQITEATRERPPGARAWRDRARHLQFQLVDLWAARAAG